MLHLEKRTTENPDPDIDLDQGSSPGKNGHRLLNRTHRPTVPVHFQSLDEQAALRDDFS